GDGGEDGKREAGPRLLDGRRPEEPRDRRAHGRCRRHGHQRALDAAREVLRLLVAEVVLAVGGRGRVGQHAQGHEGRRDVDQRLHGVGQESHGAREVVRGKLERDGDDRGRDRQPRVEGGRARLHVERFRMRRAPSFTTKPRKASAIGGRWRSRTVTTYHWRITGKPRTGTTASVRSASSCCTACAERKPRPKPAATDCLIVSLLAISMSMRGTIPDSAKAWSIASRVADPGSRVMSGSRATASSATE